MDRRGVNTISISNGRSEADTTNPARSSINRQVNWFKMRLWQRCYCCCEASSMASIYQYSHSYIRQPPTGRRGAHVDQRWHNMESYCAAASAKQWCNASELTGWESLRREKKKNWAEMITGLFLLLDLTSVGCKAGHRGSLTTSTGAALARFRCPLKASGKLWDLSSEAVVFVQVSRTTLNCDMQGCMNDLNAPEIVNYFLLPHCQPPTLLNTSGG